jgi:hypothetical protein
MGSLGVKPGNNQNIFHYFQSVKEVKIKRFHIKFNKEIRRIFIQKLIEAYKKRNYKEFVNIMKIEYEADEANIPEIEMKIVLLEILLLSPMEEGIFESMKEVGSNIFINLG